MSGDLDMNEFIENEPLDSLEDGIDAVGKEIVLTDDGGLKKKILVVGESWETPEAGDEVSVHYVGTLDDGSVFDSSRDRGTPFTFTLGRGSVIKGWDEGVKTMKRGEKSILTCRSDYAYGKQGSPPKIGPDATLNFEVELLSWKSNKDILGDGGVIKTVVSEGSGWDNPKDADEVLVKYTIKVAGQDKAVAESGEDGAEFTLQDGHVVPGIAAAVRTMKKGERVHLKLSPAYGFGPEGSPEHSVPAGASLEADLELVSWKKVENVTNDGLVTKKTLVESDEWKRPNEGAKVTLRYTAKLQDGTVVEERGEGNELKFTTDEEEVIEGLELAVMKMKKGEKALITIAPKYAYGDVEHKCPLAVVPPGSTLVYEADLVELENAKESWEMKEDGEKVDAAAAKKEKGNKAYKEGKLDKAVKYYNKAVELVNYDKSFPEAEKARAKEVKKSCWLNLAAVQLKQKEWQEAAKNCGKVLEIEPTNVKALYRRAQAYIHTVDYLEAELDLKKGLESDPQNPDLAALMRKLKALQKVQNKKESQLYGRMFKALGGKGGKEEGANGKENISRSTEEEGKQEGGEKVEAAGAPMELDGNAAST